MAEYVERNLEDMVPELEQMERVGLFSNKQIRKILTKRKNFEYKMKRQTKQKEDFISYIQYENNLLSLIWNRRKEIGYYQKKVDIDYKIQARIHQLFRIAHLRFADDIKLWLSHIAFCKQGKQVKTASKLFTSMLKIHNKKPALWIYAAKWEFEDNANPDTARNILQRGLRFNKTSKKLWLEYFRFELLYAEKMRLRQEKLMLEGQQKVDDAILKGEVAEVVYEQAKLSFPDDVAFLVSFLPICQKFDFAMEIQTKIYTDLKYEYPQSALTWDAFAKRRLENPAEAFTDGKNAEKEFHAIFELGVQEVPSDETWSLYLTGCFQLIEQANKDKLKDKRRQRVLLVLEEAKHAGHLTAAFWIQWIDLLVSLDMTDKAFSVAMDATRDRPEEIELWQKLIGLQITKNGTLDEIQQTLQTARKHIPNKNLWPIIQLVLEFSVSCLDQDATVQMFESYMNDSFEISCPAKELYLNYVYLNSDIDEARALYTRISQSPPVPVSFYTRYINIEECQGSPNVANLRKAFEDAALNHGKTNPDIWLEYIKAETKYGKPEKVGSINLRAVKTLEGSHNQEFMTQFTLLQNTGRL